MARPLRFVPALGRPAPAACPRVQGVALVDLMALCNQAGLKVPPPGMAGLDEIIENRSGQMRLALSLGRPGRLEQNGIVLSF